MSVDLDEQQVRGWLDNLYGGSTGYINIVSTGNWEGRCLPLTRVDDIINYVKLLDKRNPDGIYARVTTLRQPPDRFRRGTAADTGEFLGFWGDLDIAGPGHKLHVCDGDPCSQAAAKECNGNRVPLIADEASCLELMEITGLPAATEWVHSGGGMYPLHLLEAPHAVTDADDLDRLKAASVTWQRVIKLAAAKLGFFYGTGVNDLARVLRIPGTVNRKIDGEPVTAQWRMDLSVSQPYDLSYLIECAEKAASRLDDRPVHITQPLPTAPRSGDMSGSAGTAFNRSTTWDQLLSADGCTVFQQQGSYIEWTRPGKETAKGLSGTTGHQGSDNLHVFSDNWLPLQAGESYSKFGYYAATRHGGDMRAAARALGALGYGEPLSDTASWATSRPNPAAQWDDPMKDAFFEEDESLPDVKVLFETAPKGVTAPPTKPTFTHTDSGFADRLQARHGNDFKYIALRERKGWLRWDGSVWATDTRGTVASTVERLAQEEYAKADDLVDAEGKPDEKARDRWRASVRGMLSNQKQLGAAAVFGRRANIAINADDLDTHRHMVTCGNGVFDVKNMSFGPHDRSLLATKKLGVDYQAGATAPKWERFLEDLLPDPAVRAYLQRLLGYTLTGEADLKAIVIMWGLSNCGKGQLINALMEVFGDLGASVTEQTLLVNKSAGAATPGLQKLRGSRLVTGSETSPDAKLDEALLKRLAGGGDRIDSRGLWQDEESWIPQFTMFIATNFPPKLNSDDDAIWNRVKPIHFAQVFGKDGRPEIPNIGRKIVAEEGPGILNWIIDGLKSYREIGLAQPEAISDGVKAYQADSDPVARFINESLADETLVAEADAEITNAVLYNRFREWCAVSDGIHPMNSTRFGRRMATLGYERVKPGGHRGWKGLRNPEGTWLGSGHPLRT